jgi:hypothetical protein
LPWAPKIVAMMNSASPPRAHKPHLSKRPSTSALAVVPPRQLLSSSPAQWFGQPEFGCHPPAAHARRVVLDYLGPQTGSDPTSLRDKRRDVRTAVSHRRIILHICKQCVRTELTKGYHCLRYRRPPGQSSSISEAVSERSRGASFRIDQGMDGNGLSAETRAHQRLPKRMKRSAVVGSLHLGGVQFHRKRKSPS